MDSGADDREDFQPDDLESTLALADRLVSPGRTRSGEAPPVTSTRWSPSASFFGSEMTSQEPRDGFLTTLAQYLSDRGEEDEALGPDLARA
jgi:hypothetical protein